MTWLERSATLRDRIKKVKDLEAKTSIADDASEKAGQLAKRSGGLASQRALASVLGLGDGGEHTWPDATDTRAALARCREAITAAKDPSEPAAAKAFTALIKGTQALERDARAVVEARVDDERTSLGTLDRNALSAWRALAADTRPLDAALTDLDRLLKLSKAQWLKLSRDDLARELAAKAKIVATIDREMAVAVPPAVRTFLESARQGGATAEQFTDEVQSWLASHKQLGRVRVVFK